MPQEKSPSIHEDIMLAADYTSNLLNNLKENDAGALKKKVTITVTFRPLVIVITRE